MASGDYPDPPPHDERLRIFVQRSDEPAQRWRDATAGSGVDLPGAAQIALADFDLDGRMDLVAGQSFTRFTPAMIEAAGGAPRLRLFLNRTESEHRSLTISLRGDPSRGIAMLQRVQKRHKFYSLSRGRMIGLMYEASDAAGLWNRDFRPLRAPLPV